MNPLFYYEDFEYMYITTGRGGGGNSANYWGRGVKVGLRNAFPIPGYQAIFNCSRPYSRYTPSLLMG